MRKLGIFLSVALLAPTLAMGGKAHVHGKADMGVTLVDKTVTIQLDIPGDAVVGFEYEPKTPQETETVEGALKKLNDANSFFSWETTLGCQWAPAEAKVSYHKHHHETAETPPKVGDPKSPSIDKKPNGPKGDHIHKKGHHDHKKGGHGHGHKKGGTHSEFQVTYVATCQKAPQGQTLTTTLIEAFPKLKTVEVTVIGGSKGDAGAVLTSAKAPLNL